MKIGFIVGETEQHQMEIAFDQTTGHLYVLMDGATLLQDSPKLTRDGITHYELSIGASERQKLMLELAYGNGLEIDEPGFQPTPRLSLKVAAFAPPDSIPESLPLNSTDSVLAANTAASV